MIVDVEHDEERQQFVARVEGKNGFLRYARVDERTVDLRTTWVHPELRGRMVGETLVKRALEWARENGYAVIPTCWFVDTVVERNPGYRDLLVTR